MTWLLLKLAGLIGNVWMTRLNAIFDSILKMVEFVFKHWRVFLPLAMLCLSLLYVNALRNDIAEQTAAKITAEKALSDHLADDAEATRLRTAENIRKAEQGKLVAQNIEAKAKQELTQILIKERKKHVADKAINDRDLRNFRERVRLDIQTITAATAARLPDDDKDRPASGNGDATAVRRENEKLRSSNNTLRAGGAVCASDYNKCKAYVDSEQLRLGVEP